jgi:CheY-like chemotaxis protein
MSNVKILIVEDNKLNALIADKLLNKIGMENIDFATNGREVIQKIHDVDYDLILMDCQIPIYDGYEATKELRSLEIRTPIIALTTSVSDEDIDGCFNAGMNNHLSKSISFKR